MFVFVRKLLFWSTFVLYTHTLSSHAHSLLPFLPLLPIRRSKQQENSWGRKSTRSLQETMVDLLFHPWDVQQSRAPSLPVLFDHLHVPDFCTFLVCTRCHTLYPMSVIDQNAAAMVQAAGTHAATLASLPQLTCPHTLFRNEDGTPFKSCNNVLAKWERRVVKRKSTPVLLPIQWTKYMSLTHWLQFFVSTHTADHLDDLVHGWRQRPEPDAGIMFDVYDGAVWRGLRTQFPLNDPAIYTFVIGIYLDFDSPLLKRLFASKEQRATKLGLVVAYILNLPAELRTKLENVCIVNIIYGEPCC